MSAPVSMTVLLVHNHYQQPGGEDVAFANEVSALRSAGVDVHTLVTSNADIRKTGLARTAVGTVWSARGYRLVSEAVQKARAGIVHFHNTFPAVSPAAYYAARNSGAKVVQTLHNFRLFCSKAVLYRDGRVCHDCVGRVVRWPGVLHRCYRDSAPASVVVAAMQTVHSALRTWTRKVDRFVAVSDYVRTQFVRDGFPEASISVKRNFLPSDPGLGLADGGYALFIGRLSEEKGVVPLVEAWKHRHDLPPLVVVGDGPLKAVVAELGGRVTLLGTRPHPDVMDLMGHAKALVIPSVSVETSGLVGIEAFARGIPVVATSVGALPELAGHGRGIVVSPHDAEALAAAVASIFVNEAEFLRLRDRGRQEFESTYSPGVGIRNQLDLYRDVMASE